ncbi:MAG: glycosyltransferase [Longilinea sp.]|nr:glycosyltransferase [Longilinea sp.]MCA1954841.1 glycosyltransferase [Anaerolinea sp.]
MQTGAEQPFLSVVIPCYNEQKNLERGVLQEVQAYLTQQPYPWEVIIVNDESNDDSRHLLQEFVSQHAGFALLDIPHGGKPAAVWAGIQQARADIVLFTDMDQSTPLREVEKLLPHYAQGADVVIGSRGAGREGFSIVRKMGSFIFRTLRRLVLLPTISDTQCGFKSCRRAAALRAFPRLQFFQQKQRPKGWKVSAYDVELLYLFEKFGYRIVEVEVEWSNRDESDTKGQTGELARYVRESIEMGSEVLRVLRNRWSGLYRQ